MTVTAPPRPPRFDEDIDALIEEARRRARRRRAAYGAAALLAGLAVGLFLGLGNGGGHSQRSGSDGPPGSAGTKDRNLTANGRRMIIGEAGLVAPGVGWAANGLGFYWTVENGAHWRVVTPPDVASMGDAVARIGGVAYADRKHFWLVASDIRGVGQSAALDRHFAVERTSDGGRTWKPSIPPGCRDCGNVQLSFLDARHGFVVGELRNVTRLYRTVDGGANWQLVGKVPVDGPFVFLDPRAGWGVDSRGRSLFATSDGGRSWRKVELPVPSANRGRPVTLGVPAYFGRGVGVVAARYRDRGAQRVVVYVTHDAGRTWQARPAPPSAAGPPANWGFPKALTFSAGTARDWFLFVAPRLYATHDAGLSWTALHPRGAPTRALGIWDLSFSSDANGWALFLNHLVATSDGGRTWHPVGP